MVINLEQTNLINQENIINTRKELWTVLFCWVDFSRTQWKYKVYNKEYQFLPLVNTFVNWQKKHTEFLIQKHTELEQLINSFNPYFQTNIYPILKGDDGDKTLLFRCDRLFKNKIIGESSSLFTDLLIFEADYLAKQEAKKLLKRLENQVLFNDQKSQEQIQADIEKLLARPTCQGINIFYRKWLNLTTKQGTELVKHAWEELKKFLKQWELGKIGKSKWKTSLDNFSTKIEQFLNNDQQQNYFFSLGGIKKQNQERLVIATQNIKGWDLDNPYLMLFWFHQKPGSLNPLAYRTYFIKEFKMINPRNLYVELTLGEDWLWKNYSRSLVSMGSLSSVDHAFYHSRNLPA